VWYYMVLVVRILFVGISSRLAYYSAVQRSKWIVRELRTVDELHCLPYRWDLSFITHTYVVGLWNVLLRERTCWMFYVSGQRYTYCRSSQVIDCTVYSIAVLLYWSFLVVPIIYFFSSTFSRDRDTERIPPYYLLLCSSYSTVRASSRNNIRFMRDVGCGCRWCVVPIVCMPSLWTWRNVRMSFWTRRRESLRGTMMTTIPVQYARTKGRLVLCVAYIALIKINGYSPEQEIWTVTKIIR